MTPDKDDIRISKFLSLVLRHKPDILGIDLNDQGWIDVAMLLEKMNIMGLYITRQILDHVVATNNKKRFAFNDDRTMLRANQGHSLEIELGLQPVKPPEYLYHGTGEKLVASILASGLSKGNRHHVHLSTDIQTALKVRQRKGKPVVFEVEAQKMYEQGFEFFVSENGVWLTDHVPDIYIL